MEPLEQPRMTFLQLAYKVLEEAQKALSPEEIWELAKEKGYDAKVASQGKTPVRTLSAQMYVDVRDNPSSGLAKAGSRPTRFTLKTVIAKTGQQAGQLGQTTGPKLKRPDYLERELHQFLVYFGYQHLRSYLKTIHHAKSKKNEFGEWIHPDIVGCYFSFGDWQQEVTELSTAMGTISVDLFSFELKRELNFTNLREAFFQAVSNSSWANEGYLAAAEISEDDEFRRELERLSVSFGIGILRIDIEDPDATEILYSARHKAVVDWETINKVARLNADFRDFLKRVRNDVSTKEVIKEKYDPVPTKEELLEWGSKHKG